MVCGMNIINRIYLKKSILKIEKYAKKNNIPIMQKDGIKFIIKFIKKNNIKIK